MGVGREVFGHRNGILRCLDVARAGFELAELWCESRVSSMYVRRDC